MDKLMKQRLIESVAHKLDITPQMYQHSIRVINGITKYLQNSGITASFYKQGSFRLGTIIRPSKKDRFGDYDIDLVVEYKLQKEDISEKAAKHLLGDCLKKGVYAPYLDEEGGKCWTLNYTSSDKNVVDFHIDLLPCVPESQKEKANIQPEQYRNSAIALTHIKDKKQQPYEYCWESSNPNGYAAWFDSVNYSKYGTIKKNDRRRIFEGNRALFESVEAVADEYTRTPLQMVIQILKRHRDMMYLNSDKAEFKPISILITTLVGKIVEENQIIQNNTYELLDTVLKGLEYYASLENPGITSDFAEEFKTKKLISKRMVGGKPYWRILNPADSKENLANKWNLSSQYATEFFRWIKQAKSDLINILDLPINEIKAKFKYCLGEDVVEIFKEQDFSSIPQPKPISTTGKLPQPYLNA